MGCVLGCVRSRASSSVHVRGQAYLDELGHGEQAAAARSKVQRCVAMEVFEADECPAISEQLVARAGVPCVVGVVVSAMLWCQPWRLLLVVPVGKWASRSEASDRIDELAAALAAQLALQQASFTSR